MSTTSVPGAVEEFSDVSLGDERLDARLQTVVRRIAAKPGLSFPKQVASEAEQEGLYRFLNNPRVTLPKLLASHLDSSLERIAARPLVRIIHDTTELRFSGDREGLAPTREKAKGMFAHVTLAVGGDETREPLGVLNVHTYVGDDRPNYRRGETAYETTKRLKKTPRSQKRSCRWEESARKTGALVPSHVRAIHVMDREADDFTVFKDLIDAGASFVIRSRITRVDANDNERLTELLAKKPSESFRNVPVTARPMTRSVRRHPVRSERVAKLEVRWGEAKVFRKETELVSGGELSLFAVHVFEVGAPEGETPIEWLLMTTEPVHDLASATAVVDHYRARWIIEEYFKSLKTGCSIEKRQLCSRDALERALGLFVPVAWQLLRLRHLAHPDQTPRPATELFSVGQLDLLRVLLADIAYRLPAEPTVRDTMLGIARLGGHIKNNGEPGWIVLGRGFEDFLEADRVRMLLARRSSDQS